MNELTESMANEKGFPIPQKVGIGYNDHEYEKGIHVVVERISENVQRTFTGVDKKGKKDSMLQTPEVEDMFSCGLCGKLYTRLLSILSHRVSHASEENPMHCELCDSTTSYSHPSSFTEHYRKVHKVLIYNTYRSSNRKKPTGENKAPAKKKMSKGRNQQKRKAEISTPSTAGTSDYIVQTSGQNVDSNPKVDSSECSSSSQVIIDVTHPSVSVLPDAGEPDMAVNGEPNTLVAQTVQNECLVELSSETAPVTVNMQNVNSNFSDVTPSVVTEEQPTTHAVEMTSVDMYPQQLINNTQNIVLTVLDVQNPSSQASSIINQPDIITTTSNRLPLIAPKPTKSITPGKQKADGTQSEKEVDFYFLLATSMVRGSSFIYGKQCFKCLHCDYKSFWKSAFIKHMKAKHVEVLSQNECIEMRSTENNSNQKLMKMSDFITEYHTPPKTHEKRIIPKRQADNHGNFPCSSCDKVFPRWSNLRKHMRTHVPSKNFLCVECGKAFKTKSSLCQHHKTHKREEFNCSVCGFQSRVSAAIQAHKQFHKQGNYLCDTCGNAYIDKSTLNKHKRVHDPNRPCGCPWPDCTWRFKSEMMCNAHYRTHTTEAQYKCTYCGYSFRHKHHLRRHERQTHGIHHEKTRGGRTKLKQNEEAQAVTNITVLRPNIDENNLTQLADGQLLIPVTADSDGNPVPLQFDVSNLAAVNVAYQGFLQTGLGKVDAGTLYL